MVWFSNIMDFISSVYTQSDAEQDKRCQHMDEGRWYKQARGRLPLFRTDSAPWCLSPLHSSVIKNTALHRLFRQSMTLGTPGPKQALTTNSYRLIQLSIVREPGFGGIECPCMISTSRIPDLVSMVGSLYLQIPVFIDQRIKEVFHVLQLGLT